MFNRFLYAARRLISKRAYFVSSLVLAGVLLSLTFNTLVAAQTTPAPSESAKAPVSQPPIQTDTMSTSVRAVVSTITSAFESLLQNDGVKEAGKSITYMLFTLVLAWGLIKAMVEGEGINGIAATIIPLVGTLAIVTMLVDSGGVGKITGFMDSLAASFGMNSSLADSIQTGIYRGFSAVVNVLSMPSLNTNVPMDMFHLDQVVGVAISTLVGVLARLITAVLVIIAVAIYVANIVLAHGSIMLATALAPLMIPFILLPSLGFIFDGWLKFTLSAAMMKVVGAFMIGMTDSIMSGLVTLSEKVKLPADTDYSTIMIANYIVYAGLILMAGLCAYLMMMVPSLAQGLLSGNGGHGFRGMKAITSGSGFQTAKSAGGVGAKATNSVGSGTAGGFKGAYGAVASHVDGQRPSAYAKGNSPTKTYGRVGGFVYGRLGGR